MMRGTVRRLAQRASRAGDLRWRQPPRLAVDPAAAARPTVYYLAPDLATPSGGIRNMYRHVDALNAAGIPAAVVHTRPGFRCRWFANSTRVLGAPEVRLHPDDLLVVPECYGPGLDRLPAAPRKLIFNQGAYHTFDLIPYAGTGPGAPYAAVPNLIGLLTVSADSAALLGHAFPDLTVHRARLVVDGTVFHPAPGLPARRIAYLTRRRRDEREYLLHLLRSRGALDGWELVPIEGRTEAQTAELMRGSALFLSFSEREGFGLPPAEAMASGCFVVGFTGMGGREYFDPQYCSPVPDSDMLAFGIAVQEAMRRFDSDPHTLAKAARLASEAVLGKYHSAGLSGDLRACYGPLLDPGPDQ